MATESKTGDSDNHFDVFVIGCGSGGIAFARRAASYGKKVAIVEKARLGGTCVNVGCVPKKLMWSAASIAEAMHHAKAFGYKGVNPDFTFDWAAVKKRRDAHVERLNGIYGRNVERDGVKLLTGTARFTGPTTVAVDDTEYSADHIMIAVGGRPRYPKIPGAEHVITSDGFFELETQPKNILIVGGGYIAVELGGVLRTLGTDVTLVARSGVLKRFDPTIRETLHNDMVKQGINIITGVVPTEVTKKEDGLYASLPAKGDTAAQTIGPFESVLYAIGRDPNTSDLGLDKAGVEVRRNGTVVVDKYHNTNVPSVFAVGDVIGSGFDLTPVAIAAARTTADRLYDGKEGSTIKYGNIPTVVFSHPPIGTVGLTEPEAVAKYGEGNVKTWKSVFHAMHYSLMDIPREDRPSAVLKLIVAGDEQRVVGLHILGYGADEAAQGFGIAVAMGATKSDFDNTMAIHPTVFEDLVTMKPWQPRNPTAVELASKM